MSKDTKKGGDKKENPPQKPKEKDNVSGIIYTDKGVKYDTNAI
jgi:hypothetical protein